MTPMTIGSTRSAHALALLPGRSEDSTRRAGPSAPGPESAGTTSRQNASAMSPASAPAPPGTRMIRVS